MANPFKMWGSWVGATVAGLVMSYQFGFSKILHLFNKVQPVCDQMDSSHECIMSAQQMMPPMVFFFVGLAITLLIGFLVGWGIQSWLGRKR
jgi:predicted histidine transporter YuiF (NhaC family)